MNFFWDHWPSFNDFEAADIYVYALRDLRHNDSFDMFLLRIRCDYTVFQKTSTHIIGYKLRNSCLILIIFDTKIPHIIWHHKTA